MNVCVLCFLCLLRQGLRAIGFIAAVERWCLFRSLRVFVMYLWLLSRKAAAEKKKCLQGQLLEDEEKEVEKVKEEDLFGPPSEEWETEVERVKEEEKKQKEDGQVWAECPLDAIIRDLIVKSE